MFGCLMWSTLYFILYDIIFYEKDHLQKSLLPILCIPFDEQLHSPFGFISSSVYKAFLVVVFYITYIFLWKENIFIHRGCFVGFMTYVYL